jgi:hypothetical protein
LATFLAAMKFMVYLNIYVNQIKNYVANPASSNKLTLAGIYIWQNDLASKLPALPATYLFRRNSVFPIT